MGKGPEGREGQAWTPYSYVGGNPVNAVDPDGRDIGWVVTGSGDVVWDDRVKSQAQAEQLYGQDAQYKGENKYFIDKSGTVNIHEELIPMIITPESNEYKIFVRRFAESERTTLSEFIAYGEGCKKYVRGYFLEPAGPSTYKSNMDRRIPADIYNVIYHSTSKHPNTYLIYNDKVSPSRGILIHIGNYYYDTRGCYLPGDSYSLINGDYVVLNSGKTMNNIRKLLRKHEAKLIIIEDLKK